MWTHPKRSWACFILKKSQQKPGGGGVSKWENRWKKNLQFLFCVGLLLGWFVVVSSLL